MSERWRVALFVLLLMAVILIYMTVEFGEQTTQSIEVGYSGVARLNRLLALERTLTTLGVKAQSVRRYADIKTPSTEDWLVIKAVPSLSEVQTEALIAWIVQGGRVIVEADARLERRQTATLLQRLGVTFYEAAESASNADDSSISVVTPTQTFAVSFPPSDLVPSLDREAEWVIDERGQTFVVRYAVGHGHITIFSDLHFLNNRHLAEQDHADFFYWLIYEEGPPNKVWLQYWAEFPSLWQLLWTQAPLVWVTLCLLVILWFAQASYRFGPLLPTKLRQQRSLMEHIDASGDFLWRQQKSAELIHSAREALFAAVEKRHPGWQALSETDQLMLLADLTGESYETLKTTLATLDAQQQRDFTDLIQRLSFIRKKL